MNKKRRGEVQRIIIDLTDLESDVRLLGEEEQEYFDNMPESFQCGEEGEKVEEAIELLTEASDSIQLVIESLNELL